MERVVARIGRAHGVRGELTVEVRTDDPARRLAVGAVLATDPATAGPVEVTGARDHNGVLLLRLRGVDDRTAAERLRGVLLLVRDGVGGDDAARPGPDGGPAGALGADDEDDAWYPSELVGLRVEAPSGERLGTVVRLEHLPAQDLLVVAVTSGEERLVPFVRALVPVVDVTAGRVVVDAPPGLLEDLEEG